MQFDVELIDQRIEQQLGSQVVQQDRDVRQQIQWQIAQLNCGSLSPQDLALLDQQLTKQVTQHVGPHEVRDCTQSTFFEIPQHTGNCGKVAVARFVRVLHS